MVLAAASSHTRVLRAGSKYITHPNLAQYIDVVRGRASRLGVVCEHSELHLAEFLQRRHCAGLPQEHVWVCAAQLLSAVATIHEQGLVHHSEPLATRSLPHSVCLTESIVPTFMVNRAVFQQRVGLSRWQRSCSDFGQLRCAYAQACKLGFALSDCWRNACAVPSSRPTIHVSRGSSGRSRPPGCSHVDTCHWTPAYPVGQYQ